MRRNFRSEGIILKRVNYSEADRLLTLYTKHFGKITALAKGVRKPKSRKRGSIEVFSKIDFQAVGSKGFDIVTEVEILDSFANLRKRIKKVSLAYFFLEAIDKLTREDEENHKLYDLLVAYLEKLQKSQKLKTLQEKFTKDILVLLGYWPENKKMIDSISIIKQVSERDMTSVRVGKRVLS